MRDTTSFRLGAVADIPALLTMYHEMIDAMDTGTWHTQWRKGVYPIESDLLSAINNGELYVAVRENQPAAAVIFNHRCHPGYNEVPWQVQCTAQQVGCIHTLGVSVHCRRCGIATALMQYVASVARARGCKCLRLDVIDTARGIIPFYRSLGFSCRETRHLVYDTVSANFDMMELVL